MHFKKPRRSTPSLLKFSLMKSPISLLSSVLPLNSAPASMPCIYPDTRDDVFIPGSQPLFGLCGTDNPGRALPISHPAKGTIKNRTKRPPPANSIVNHPALPIYFEPLRRLSLEYTHGLDGPSYQPALRHRPKRAPALLPIQPSAGRCSGIKIGRG